MFLRLFSRHLRLNSYHAQFKDLDPIDKIHKCLLMMESKVISDLSTPTLLTGGSVTFFLGCFSSGSYLLLSPAALFILGTGLILAERFNSELALTKISDLSAYECAKIVEVAAELKIEASSHNYNKIGETKHGKNVVFSMTDKETITNDTPLCAAMGAFKDEFLRLEHEGVNNQSRVVKKTQ